MYDWQNGYTTISVSQQTAISRKTSRWPRVSAAAMSSIVSAAAAAFSAYAAFAALSIASQSEKVAFELARTAVAEEATQHAISLQRKSLEATRSLFVFKESNKNTTDELQKQLLVDIEDGYEQVVFEYNEISVDPIFHLIEKSESMSDIANVRMQMQLVRLSEFRLDAQQQARDIMANMILKP